MKLTYEDDPFEYISKIKYITESIKKLKIDVDFFLQYFFWSGLNESFRNILIQITNHSKPTLMEITDNFFEASERYFSQKHFKERKKKSDSPVLNSASSRECTTSLAVKVDYSKDKTRSSKPCSLCIVVDRDISHPVYRCPVFKTPQEKIDKLVSLSGCIKCGNLNHTSDNCKFKFNSRCSNCKGWHMSYLCVGNPRKKESTADKSKVNSGLDKSKDNSKLNIASSNLITLTEALQGDTDGESILPTFTCKIGGKRVRGLKDGGCQSNFITESLASQLDLKVIKDNFSITVNGINVPKTYKSKLVEFNVKFGDELKTIKALCIPSINIVLKLPNLRKVVDSFLMQGYKLADESLKNCQDEISDIEFILGCKSSYCIPDSEVLFGERKMSLYSQTPLGIILKGDINQLLHDLEDLPVNSNSYSIMDPGNYFPVKNTSCLTSTDNCIEVIDCCNANFSVFNDKGDLVDAELQRATNDILESQCSYYTNHDNQIYDDETSEINNDLVKFALDNTVRDERGRLKMPLLWNPKVSHLLGRNRKLATLILRANLNKLLKNEENLKLMNDTFQEQAAAGIIEKINDLDDFLETHPEHSFLPHMPIFKPDRETTKCRIVFLSNLCEKDPTKPMTVSHNQAIYPGPTLNHKISSALLHLRFDPFICTFDIKKAFNNISLEEIDQNKLLFLWFRNVQKRDFSIIAYKNVRLPFGLRCSPTILLLGLFKILVLDSEDDSSGIRYLKHLIYQLCYMDNCAFTAEDSANLIWAYNQLNSIFEPYKFGLQQFMSNDSNLQSLIDSDLEGETPIKVKLLGMRWDRSKDTLSTNPINLDPQANTKRLILRSIASQYDVHNYNAPLLNRSRLFLHRLQCQKELTWDQTLSPDVLREWRLIAKQANASLVVEIKRFVGKRQSSYKLIGFSDSSKSMYGAVIYIKDLETKEISFLSGKNRIVNKQLECKSIPSLEIQGIALATECILDLYADLAGPSCIKPIHITEIEIFSDSLVSLAWLNSYSTKLDKMQKRSVFVMNRIKHITKLCETHPIKFSFVSGTKNPADCITRSMSHKQLVKSNYYSGPPFLSNCITPELSRDDIFSVIIPNPLADVDNISPSSETHSLLSSYSLVGCLKNLMLLDRFSSFNRLVKVYSKILIFVNKLKAKVKSKYPDRFSHFEDKDDANFFSEATRQIILKDQQSEFPEVFKYFHSNSRNVKDIPNIVKQLNVFMDRDGLLRVRSKCERLRSVERFKRYSFPLLLAKKSVLTPLIILDMHRKLAHAGCYSLLTELRKTFWIPHFFSIVKRILKTCTTCRRFNERTVKLNQSPYRMCRLNPSNIPFNNIYVDFMGPFTVKLYGQNSKVWILCITCMWSRAINLKICSNLSVVEFLRAFQLHCFEFGIPSFCISDLGTQLTAGANIISDFFKDHETRKYFDENNVQPLSFDHFFKGHSKLGSMVEICVKLTKRLLFGSIGKNILPYRDFEFIVCKTVHLVNRRPIAFKEALRDSSGDCVPDSITPEVLIRGYDLLSLNIIPELQRNPEPEWMPFEPLNKVKNNYEKLQKTRNKLIDIYNEEFLCTLIHQAVNLKDRYKPVTHKILQRGDIVLIKEPMTKQSNYPMAIVKDVVKNLHNEITGAIVMKGKTREILKRHSSTLIPLLRKEELPNNDEMITLPGPSVVECSARPKRRTAIESEIKTKDILDNF
ncbi:uncharacterized protein [Macrobrachium rosenbergii]|uniref:uncharacterized protein n=1 Tax=Macrobrachium rosenbergii TaxID=79674 RepID=UPI0034D79BCD